MTKGHNGTDRPEALRLRAAAWLVGTVLLAAGCNESMLEPEFASNMVATGALLVDPLSADVKIVTFGDSNVDGGWPGTKNSPVYAYISSRGKYALSADEPNSPLQLAGKIEQQWSNLRGTVLYAANHGIFATTTGGNVFGGKDRVLDAPQARTVVDGVTRFEAEVLGVGAPNWNGGETDTRYFPDGPVTRVRAFVPDDRSFAYVSMGTNDIRRYMTAAQTTANLQWMIERWLAAGHGAERFIITTLAPMSTVSESEQIVELNDSIRSLAARTGTHLLDLAQFVSDDNGLTWRSADLHVGDMLHHSEAVRDWIAREVVLYIDSVLPAVIPPGSPSATFAVTDGEPLMEGTALTFDASDSADPNGDELTYTWLFGDGSSATGRIVTHAYLDNGEYFAVLSVTNTSGLEDRVSQPIVIENAAPVVHAGPDASHVTGVAFTLAAEFTDSGVADGYWAYVVDWGDGTTTEGNLKTVGSFSKVAKVYEAPGTFTVRVYVTDKEGAVGHDEAVINVVSPVAPIAIADGPYDGIEGDWLTLSAEGSSGGSGDTLSYRWEFGDGTVSSGTKYEQVNKRYGDDGTYEIRLIVTNQYGAADTTLTVATIVNVPPTARLSAPGGIYEGSGYTIDINRAKDSGFDDGATLEFALDCGQGAGYSPWNQAVVSLECTAPADQREPIIARGKVRDKDGGETEYTSEIKVYNTEPVVALEATTSTDLLVGETLTVAGTFTDAGVSDGPWSYTILWGDGTTTEGTVSDQSSSIVASHTYTQSASATVTLWVVDKDGALGKAAIPVLVSDNAGN